MKYRKIYFTQSAHRFFLSLYQPNEVSLVVFCGDEGSYRFLRQLLPSQEIISIPNVNIENLKEVESWCSDHRKYFDEIPIETEVFFFGWPGFMPFFILHDFFIKKGVRAFYINALLPGWWYEPVEKHGLGDKALRLENILGFPVTRFRTRMWPFWGPTKLPPYSELSLEPWPRLSDRYLGDNANVLEDTVLLLDGPIQALASVPGGIDIPETRRKLVTFLSGLIGHGKKIHLKPHPGGNHGNHSLHGTKLEEMISVLPINIPAEMIMNRYSEVYGFNSSSLAEPITGRKYSLGKLVVFTSGVVEEEFWALLEDFTGMGNNVEVLKFD